MSARYQYIKIGAGYFCLQQNPIVLAWFLFFRNDALRPHLLKLSKKSAMRCLATLVQHRLHLRKNRASILELPVYGNLSVPVRTGYKVFNFHQKSVTKVIAPEIDQAAVVCEIEGVRTAALLDCASSIRRWNIEQRWYEEDFITGDRGYVIPQAEPASLLNIYYRHVAPVIEDMILLNPPLTKKVDVYLDEMLDEISGLLDNKRSANPPLPGERINAFQSFVKAVASQLLFHSNCQVDLVFSHGDFGFLNILTARRGVMVIDWETAARRTMLNDLYNYFFTELYYRRVKTDLVAEINDAVLSLQSRLNSKKPIGITSNQLLFAQIYRWFYYLERLQVLLQSESRRGLDVVMRSIEVFNHYEEVVGNKGFRAA